MSSRRECKSRVDQLANQNSLFLVSVEGEVDNRSKGRDSAGAQDENR